MIVTFKTRRNKRRKCETAVFRCVKIIKTLSENRGGLRVKDAAEEFCVSERTILRDIHIIESAGYALVFKPDGYSKGMSGVWKFHGDYAPR